MGSEEYKERGEEGYSGRTVRFDAYVRFTIGMVLDRDGGKCDANAASRIARHVQRLLLFLFHRFFHETSALARIHAAVWKTCLECEFSRAPARGARR